MSESDKKKAPTSGQAKGNGKPSGKPQPTGKQDGRPGSQGKGRPDPEAALRAETYEEQLERFRENGILVEDPVFCRRVLRTVNWYRLSNYFVPFQNKDGTFQKGVTFEQIFRTYEFDRHMRRILLSAIEVVEIYLRSQIAYYHAHQYGPLGYLEAGTFSSQHAHDRLIQYLEREITKDKNVEIKDRRDFSLYKEQLPIWMVIETLSIGMLSHFYNDLTTQDKKVIAAELYDTTPKMVTSWLHCVTNLRNICAHYSRLYFRIFTAYPAGTDMPDSRKRRLWGAIYAVRALYPSAEKWNGEVLSALEELFKGYEEDIRLFHIGFPVDWAEQLRK